MIPGSIYDRTTPAADKRQLTGPMYANNLASTFRTHDPLSYIDPGASQPLNGLNLPMPHQMMMPPMPMSYMGGPAPFNSMANGRPMNNQATTMQAGPAAAAKGAKGAARMKNPLKPPRFSKTNGATQSQVRCFGKEDSPTEFSFFRTIPA